MSFEPDQYRAVRQAAGVLDRSSRGRIVLNGADRRTFLHALLTNDIVALGPGTGCYAALLTPQGRLITDMRVFELGDVVLLDVPGATKDELLAKLDQMLFSEDVQIGDVSGGFGCISVQGPLAPGVVASTLSLQGHDLGSWAPWRNARVTWAGETVILARVDEFGLPGFLLFTAMAAVPALAAATGGNGAVIVEPATADALRIEAGMPEWGADMTADTIPIEAGLEGTAISYSKGCFPGQEVLVRIRDRGHGRVARKLVGLTLDAGDVPQAGAEVFNGDRSVGQVTSAVHSPALGRPVALAYVHRDSVEPGTALAVSVGGGTAPALVAALPFVP
jgi:folate-binding protein YgfZ